MTRFDVYTLQKRMRLCEYVSIPRLQKEFNVPYSFAKKMLLKLIEIKWIEAEPNGYKHTINSWRLVHRKITDEDVEALIDFLDQSNARVFHELAIKDGMSLKEIEKGLFTIDKIPEILESMIEMGLIYEHDKKYYTRVTKELINVFNSVARHKRQYQTAKMPVDRNKLRNIFYGFLKE